MSGSVGATASIATADALASLLSLLVVGQVVDRFHRVWVMRLAQFAETFFAVALFAVVQLHFTALWVWMAVAALQSCASTFSSNAESASTRSVVTPEQMYKAMNTRQGRMFVVTLLGPAIGGAMVQYTAPSMVFLLAVAGNVLAQIILLAFLRVGDVPSAHGENDSGDPARESKLRFALGGVHELATNPTIRAIALNMLYLGLAGSMITPAVTYGFTQRGWPATAVSAVMVASGVGGLLGIVLLAPLVDRCQWHIGTVAICAVAVEGVLVAVASRFDMWPVYVAAFGLMSAMVPLAANGLNGFLAVYTPNELQGRVFAAVGLCSSLIGVAAPGIVAALLSHAGGLGGTMIALSLVYVLAILTIVISPILRSIPSSKHWSEYIAQVKEVR